MKKRGFLKRIFSFGRQKQEETKIEPNDQIVDQVEEFDVEEKTAPEFIDAPIPKSEKIIEDKIAEDRGNSDQLPQIIDSGPKLTEQIIVHEHDGSSESSDLKSVIEPILEELTERDSTNSDLAEITDDYELDVVDEEQGKEKELEISSHIVEKSELNDEEETSEKPEVKPSWFKRLSKGLSRSSVQLTDNIAAIFTKKKLDEAALEELEDILLQADLGMDTTLSIIDSLAKQRMGKNVDDQEVRSIMAEEIEKTLAPIAMPLELDLDRKPHVILVVGVNGSGKTTTIGKLAQKLADAKYSTMLAAGDTFRAAAIEQLTIWGERTGSPVISKSLGSDSSALAYDAWLKAKEQQSDILIMDTAGRLQNKQELMAELEKIIRVFKKHDPSAPHTVLLTLDATTGQNALNQVEAFQRVAGVNGLIMTKLDGSARGGILVAISAKYKLPVYFIGVGEQVEDLEPFEAREFARSIAGLDA